MLCSMSCYTHSQIHYCIGVWPPEKRLKHTMWVQTQGSKVSLSLTSFILPSDTNGPHKKKHLYWQLWMFLISCLSARGTPSEHLPFDKVSPSRELSNLSVQSEWLPHPPMQCKSVGSNFVFEHWLLLCGQNMVFKK